jgi:hypothetical protein
MIEAPDRVCRPKKKNDFFSKELEHEPGVKQTVVDKFTLFPPSK